MYLNIWHVSLADILGLGGSIITAVTALSITAIVLMFGALIFGLLVIIKQKPAMAIAAGITGMFACKQISLL